MKRAADKGRRIRRGIPKLKKASNPSMMAMA